MKLHCKTVLASFAFLHHDRSCNHARKKLLRRTFYLSVIRSWLQQKWIKNKKVLKYFILVETPVSARIRIYVGRWKLEEILFLEKFATYAEPDPKTAYFFRQNDCLFTLMLSCLLSLCALQIIPNHVTQISRKPHNTRSNVVLRKMGKWLILQIIILRSLAGRIKLKWLKVVMTLSRGVRSGS